jgi:hypothetical protein
MRNSNVGIGISTPESRLHLEQSAGAWDEGIRLSYGEHDWDIITDYGGERLAIAQDQDSTKGLVIQNGKAGIGTSSPGARLHVNQSAGTWGEGVRVSYGGHSWDIVSDSGGDRLFIAQDETSEKGLTIVDGKVGIGTTNPMVKLDIRSSDSSSLFVETLSSSVNAFFNVYNTSGGNAIIATSNSNSSPTVQISNSGSAGALSVSGTAKVDVLQIMGADVAEKFPIHRKDEIEPGMVVSIDPDHPGELCLSRVAYNQCVAGVISGANNLPAGAILGNLPDQNDGLPVALSGRVWVYCDAKERQIEPGNLLTTADRPGYAMAVSNFEKANGAVIGKAMTRLEKGKAGLVLVLVNLQ